jgi:mannose PTS system EIIA component
MINGLVVTHGEFGIQLVSVVEMIMGPVPGLTGRTNSRKSVSELADEIKEWIASQHNSDVILFIDDFGGSCANAAQLAGVAGSTTRILTGVNLAMLLDFVTWRETMPIEELPRRLVEKGRQAITAMGPVEEG